MSEPIQAANDLRIFANLTRSGHLEIAFYLNHFAEPNEALEVDSFINVAEDLSKLVDGLQSIQRANSKVEFEWPSDENRVSWAIEGDGQDAIITVKTSGATKMNFAFRCSKLSLLKEMTIALTELWRRHLSESETQLEGFSFSQVDELKKLK